MENGGAPREDRWSEALAVGSLPFLERVKAILASRPRIGKCWKQTERMRCANRLKLTLAI
jgi:hypothetical protein